jgi:hypothetical protein
LATAAIAACLTMTGSNSERPFTRPAIGVTGFVPSPEMGTVQTVTDTPDECQQAQLDRFFMIPRSGLRRA